MLICESWIVWLMSHHRVCHLYQLPHALILSHRKILFWVKKCQENTFLVKSYCWSLHVRYFTPSIKQWFGYKVPKLKLCVPTACLLQSADRKRSWSNSRPLPPMVSWSLRASSRQLRTSPRKTPTRWENDSQDDLILYLFQLKLSFSAVQSGHQLIT